MRVISIVPESEVMIGKGVVGGRRGAGMACCPVNRMKGLVGMRVTSAFAGTNPWIAA